MPRRPDVLCAGTCGELIWRGTGSRTDPMCRPCRREARPVRHKATKEIGCSEPVWSNCWTCGASMSKRRGTRYCGRSCQPFEVEQLRRRLVETDCGWCGRPTEQEAGDTHRATAACSRECQTSIAHWKLGHNSSPWHVGIAECWTPKQRRRAREKMSMVGRFRRSDIFERDQYTCHLCGRQTDPLIRVPDPFAPTLDHVVPLSKGGSHTEGNIRTACFICNSRRGDRSVDEFRTSLVT